MRSPEQLLLADAAGIQIRGAKANRFARLVTVQIIKPGVPRRIRNQESLSLTLQLPITFRLVASDNLGCDVDGIKIGTLAREAGIGAGALRYYERLGLLPASHRSASGYRLYEPTSARRLRFIRKAQALGFSLDEIAELLALSDNPNARASKVKRVTQDKIADIERRIKQLRRMRQGLMALAARCDGPGPTGECPILAALSQDES